MAGGRLRRLVSAGAGFPSAEVYALAAKLVHGAVLAASGLLVLMLLDPARIGVFLAFANLAGLSLLADLGLIYSLLLAVSSRPADEAGPVASAAFAAGLPTAALTGVLLFAVGAAVFAGSRIDGGTWLWPWLSYCIVSSAQVVLMLGLTYAEGTGRRLEAWRGQFRIELLAGAVLLATIALGAELWSLAAASAARVLILAWLCARRFEMPRCAAAARAGVWRRQLWPMQWKVLVSNAVAMIATRLLTPILLVAQGAVAAGQVGLVLALSALVMVTSSVWPMSQTALYSSLYHEGQGAALTGRFRRAFAGSTLLAVLAAAAIGLGCDVLRASSAHMAERLPAPGIVWLVLAAAPLGHLANCLMIGIRCQRTDPAVIPGLLLLVPALAAYWYAARLGPESFALAYLAVNAAFALLYGVYFRRFIVAVRARR